MQAEIRPSTLGILTKFWEPGRVKTRLGGSIGMQRAAALHRLFLTHLCLRLAQTGDRREVCLDPAEKMDAFRDALESLDIHQQWQISGQGDGTLGSRMQAWFERELVEKHATTAILIGADCPTLGWAEVEQAQTLLQTHQVVIGPASDGGYVLIGLRGPWVSGSGGHSLLFDEIPWSTTSVLDVTRQQLRIAGFSAAELPTMTDVDTKSDLDELCRQMSGAEQAGLRSKIESILRDTTLCEEKP